MIDSDLNFLKAKYKEIKDARNIANALYDEGQKLLKEKEEMEKDPIIKKYLKINNRMRDISNGLEKLQNTSIKWDYTDEQIIDLFNNSPIYSGITNGIYVCFGGYSMKFKDNDSTEFILDKSELLPYYSSSVYYRVYRDIESNKEQTIPKSEWNQFEQDNIILFPENEPAKDYYNKVRLLFYQTCMNRNQELAIQKVLNKKNNSN